ncbi:response regulator [Methylophaga sp.]|uniref:response regulator n=1 Tax=Methylophaga sp. TaxID=2024840 RepID=UPI003A92534B
MTKLMALVVDDSRVARMTLSKLLRDHSYSSVEWGSAEEAMQWLQTTDTLPDIIFMDVMMATMDGLTATSQLKQHPQWGHIPVVICTGNETEADQKKAFEAGASAVLSKPPEADKLESILDEIEFSAIPLPDAAHAHAHADSESAQPEINVILASFKDELLRDVEQRLQSSSTTQSEASDQFGRDEVVQLVRELTEQQFSALKQSLSIQLNELVSITAEPVLEQTLKEMDLSSNIDRALEQNATKWLDKQQNVVRESVLRQLKHDLNPLVAKSLERLVNEKILPLIRNQVTAMKNEFDTSHQEQWAQIQAQLMMQRNISIGVGVIAILALIFVLI